MEKPIWNGNSSGKISNNTLDTEYKDQLKEILSKINSDVLSLSDKECDENNDKKIRSKEARENN